MKARLAKICSLLPFAFLLALGSLLMGCADRSAFEVRRMEHYDFILHSDKDGWLGDDISQYQVFFLVKGTPKDLAERYERLESYAREFLDSETVAHYKDEIISKYGEDTKKSVMLRFFRTSRYLPWKMGENFHYPEIEEGFPVDWIGVFTLDLDKQEFCYNMVWERKSGFSDYDYGKIEGEYFPKEMKNASSFYKKD